MFLRVVTVRLSSGFTFNGSLSMQLPSSGPQIFVTEVIFSIATSFVLPSTMTSRIHLSISLVTPIIPSVSEITFSQAVDVFQVSFQPNMRSSLPSAVLESRNLSDAHA